MNVLATLAALSVQAEHRVMVCTDRHCRHRSQILDMYAVPYRGHRVAVTVDGDRYDVQIDRDPGKTRRGMTLEQMVDFVEAATEGGD